MADDFERERQAAGGINREEIDRLNKDIEEVIEDEEDISARESTKGKWAELAKLVGAKERVEEIAADWSGDLIVPIFVFGSVEETTIRSLLLMAPASDRPGLQDHVYSKGQKKRLAKRFKDSKDPSLIVRDMWLTGFDAPCCHTMAVNKNKPMAGHNLMQACHRNSERDFTAEAQRS